MNKDLIIVRGGGDIASGIIHKLYKCGFKIVILETDQPTSIRREVCFSEAVYDKIKTVEEVTCKLANNTQEIDTILKENNIPVIIDTKGEYIQKLKPLAVVDSILAKRNLGTNKSMAPITIGVGPGFNALEDVDCVIETMRGHNLGRIIYQGSAIPNTGIPGIIKGISKERVIYSNTNGTIKTIKNIGEVVKQNEVIAYINETPVLATIDGVLRGIIKNNLYVKENLKIADIDPRLEEIQNSYTISDKARTIAGAVVEAILYLKQKTK